MPLINTTYPQKNQRNTASIHFKGQLPPGLTLKSTVGILKRVTSASLFFVFRNFCSHQSTKSDRNWFPIFMGCVPSHLGNQCQKSHRSLSCIAFKPQNIRALGIISHSSLAKRTNNSWDLSKNFSLGARSCSPLS